jgi:hypothetical protein
MAKRYADVSFNDDGTYTIEAVGFEGTGKACVDFTRPIEEALGPVTSRTMKPEAGDKKVKVPAQRVKA